MHASHTTLANATLGDPLLQALQSSIHELAPLLAPHERRELAGEVALQAMEAEALGESAVEAALIEMHAIITGLRFDV